MPRSSIKIDTGRRDFLVHASVFAIISAAPVQSLGQTAQIVEATTSFGPWYSVFFTIVNEIAKNAGDIIGWIIKFPDRKSELCTISVENISDLYGRVYQVYLSLNSRDGVPFSDEGDSGLIKAAQDYMKEPNQKNFQKLKKEESAFLWAANLYVEQIKSMPSLLNSILKNDGPEAIAILDNNLRRIIELMRFVHTRSPKPTAGEIEEMLKKLAGLLPVISEAKRQTDKLIDYRINLVCK